MTGRRRTKKLHQADAAEAERRKQNAGSLEQAHRRLQHLYEVSTLLTRFESVDKTVPAIIAVVTRTLPLRSAIFLLETKGGPRTIVWQAEDSSADRLRAATAHARSSYAYLVGPAAASSVLNEGSTERSEVADPATKAGEHHNFIILPLALEQQPIFGALHLEATGRVDEMDLVFVNSVVNQLAIALDRQAAIEVKQASSEAGRLYAEGRQVTAEEERGEAERNRDAARAEREAEARARAAAETSQQRVQEQLDFTRAVTGSLGEGVIAVDLTGRVTLFNAAAEEMLGWQEAEALGQLVQEILQIRRADNTSIGAEEYINLVMQKGHSFQTEEQLFSGRGQTSFPVSYRSAPLRRGGQISGAVFVFQDISERKQAEAMSSRLKAIIESSDDAIVSKTLDGIITSWNRSAEQMFGYTAEEAVGQHITLIIPAERRAEEDDVLARLRRGEKVDHFETERQAKDGKRIDISLTISPIRDAAGKIIGASKVARDISERKRAEEASRAAAERFRFMAESMPQKIFTATASGEMDYLNQQWTSFTGASFEQLQDRGWTQFIHPDDLEETVNHWRHSIDTGEPFQVEHRFRRPDGDYLWHLSRAHAMRSTEGEVVMWIGSNTDIDEQKRAESGQRLLAEISARLMSTPGYRETLQGIARFSVPLLADFCVVDEVEPGGEVRKLEVVFADETKQRNLADLARRFAPQRGWHTPQARVLESGESFFLADVASEGVENISQDEDHAQFMRDVDVKSMIVVPLLARGSTLGAITFVMAESNRRYSSSDLDLAQEIAHIATLSIDNARLYEQAQLATRAREELLALVSHDLKNPLGVILMAADLMERGSGAASWGDERRKSSRQITSIKRSAERMNRLIQDLLDAASIDAGKLSIAQQRLAVASFVNETIEVMRPLAESMSLDLKNEVPADLPAVFADAGRLQQVFANLLGNAIKFTPAGGTIIVRATEVEGVVQFSVIDTGSGVPEEELPHLFERFWQASRTARQGTGLGLSIAKGIIVAHGGRIWVSSRPGAGSTFFFTLPLAPHDAREPAEDAAPKPRTAPSA